MDIGNSLRRLRTAKNIKATDIADLLKVSLTTYNRIETNQSDLDANLVPKIAEYFGTTVSEIYGIDDKRTLTNPTQHIKDSATGIIAQEYHNKGQPTPAINEQNPLERIIAALEKTIGSQSTLIASLQSQVALLEARVNKAKE